MGSADERFEEMVKSFKEQQRSAARERLKVDKRSKTHHRVTQVFTTAVVTLFALWVVSAIAWGVASFWVWAFS